MQYNLLVLLTTLPNCPFVSLCDVTWTRAQRSMAHILLHAAHVVLRDKAAIFDIDTYKATGILPFATLSKVSCLSTVHKLLTRDDANSFLLMVFSVRVRSTRNSNCRKFVLPQHRLSSVKNFFYYAAACLWNTLAYNLSNVLDFNQFFKLMSLDIIGLSL